MGVSLSTPKPTNIFTLFRGGFAQPTAVGIFTRLGRQGVPGVIVEAQFALFKKVMWSPSLWGRALPKRCRQWSLFLMIFLCLPPLHRACTMPPSSRLAFARGFVLCLRP